MPPHGPEAGDSATRRFTPPPLPFVGRDKELRGLGDMLKSVKRGSTSLAIITGESGVGKTALASHVATDATALGWQVATGTAYEMEVNSPYAIFADALSPLCTTLDGLSLAMATRGMEHELARIIPALATKRLTGPGVTVDTPSQSRWHFNEFSTGSPASDRCS